MSFPGIGRAPWRSHPAMKGLDMTEVIRSIHTDFSLLEDVIQILPEQGCIEVQHDGPGKVHGWHQHANEETLIILKGKMTFALESGVHVCGPGEMLAQFGGRYAKTPDEGAPHTLVVCEAAFVCDALQTQLRVIGKHSLCGIDTQILDGPSWRDACFINVKPGEAPQ